MLFCFSFTLYLQCVVKKSRFQLKYRRNISLLSFYFVFYQLSFFFWGGEIRNNFTLYNLYLLMGRGARGWGRGEQPLFFSRTFLNFSYNLQLITVCLSDHLLICRSLSLLLFSSLFSSSILFLRFRPSLPLLFISLPLFVPSTF